MVRRRFVMATCSPSTVGEPLPQQVTNVAEQDQTHDDTEPREPKFSLLASGFEWEVALPELAPSVQSEVVCPIIRFDCQYVSGNPKEERSKRT